MKKIASIVMMFALVVSAFGTQAQVVRAQSTTDIFDFGGFNLGGLTSVLPDLNLSTINLTSTTCEITANNTSVFTGGSVVLNWNTSGFDTVSINGQTMNALDGSYTMTNILANTVYTLTAATADGASHCTASVTVTCLPAPVDCRLEVNKIVDKATAAVGDTLTYTITVKNVGTTDCTGSGVKIQDVLSDKLSYLGSNTSFNITPGYDGGIPVYTPSDRTLHFNGNVLNPGESGTMTVTAKVNTPTSCGDFAIENQARATAKELNNFGTWANSPVVRTNVTNTCPNDPAPSCDSFSATPSTIMVGGSSVLAWQTSNATSVTLNNGIGAVAADGSRTVSPTVNTNYTLTVNGTQGRSVTCNAPVTVSVVPVPVCEYFTATPNNFAAPGGTTNLSWKVTNATNVSISPAIGTVAAQGTQATNVTASTNFVLTASDNAGHTVSCTAPVTVQPPVVDTFTCANNVTFTASDSSITRGDNAVLTWNVTGADSASISPIGVNTLGGSYTVEPTSDTTYTLTAVKAGKSISCPLTITVSSGGGGGGGSPSPRCELSVSDNQITAGQTVTLKWDSKNATNVLLKDSHGKTLVDTEDMSTKEKKDKLDGSLKVSPTKDTKYTFVAKRGSKERTCTVNVGILKVVTDRQPTVAGISLDNVPYTGFEAGPLLTVFFYLLLTAWALFLTYLIVVRRKPVVGNMGAMMLAGAPASDAAQKIEEIRPDIFPATITPSVTIAAVPANLPVAVAPVIGYENHTEMYNPVNPHHVTDTVVTALENRAHDQMALLSSDALRHFIATTEGSVERNEALDEVIAAAKGQYPLEDGWIVINETRMQSLCETCLVRKAASTEAPYVPALIPEGSSSLAEAIVTGNVVAAYEMIGNRPMFALADAAADFDNVVRARRGEVVTVSALLATEAAKLSDEKIKNVVAALTGALDGTYTDEASAVKMAIMKAVKEVA